MNNIHDKVFTCPKCGNRTLYPLNWNEDNLELIITKYVFVMNVQQNYGQSHNMIIR